MPDQTSAVWPVRELIPNTHSHFHLGDTRHVLQYSTTNVVAEEGAAEALAAEGGGESLTAVPVKHGSSVKLGDAKHGGSYETTMRAYFVPEVFQPGVAAEATALSERLKRRGTNVRMVADARVFHTYDSTTMAGYPPLSERPAVSAVCAAGKSDTKKEPRNGQSDVALGDPRHLHYSTSTATAYVDLDISEPPKATPVPAPAQILPREQALPFFQDQFHTTHETVFQPMTGRHKRDVQENIKKRGSLSSVRIGDASLLEHGRFVTLNDKFYGTPPKDLPQEAVRPTHRREVDLFPDSWLRRGAHGALDDAQDIHSTVPTLGSGSAPAKWCIPGTTHAEAYVPFAPKEVIAANGLNDPNAAAEKKAHLLADSIPKGDRHADARQWQAMSQSQYTPMPLPEMHKLDNRLHTLSHFHLGGDGEPVRQPGGVETDLQAYETTTGLAYPAMPICKRGLMRPKQRSHQGSDVDDLIGSVHYRNSSDWHTSAYTNYNAAFQKPSSEHLEPHELKRSQPPAPKQCIITSTLRADPYDTTNTVTYVPHALQRTEATTTKQKALRDSVVLGEVGRYRKM